MTAQEQKVYELVHNWCDEQAQEIPDMNRRALMDDILEVINSLKSSLLLAGKVALEARLVTMANTKNLSDRIIEMETALDEYDDYIISKIWQNYDKTRTKTSISIRKTI